MMDSIDNILKLSHRIESRSKREVIVLGKTFRIGDLTRKVLNKIIAIQFKVKFHDEEENMKNLTKRLRYISDADAKIAAYILLNKWSYIPLVHSIYWRYLNMRYNSEHFSAIIKEGMDSDEHAFFLKSSVVSLGALMTRMQMIKEL